MKMVAYEALLPDGARRCHNETISIAGLALASKRKLLQLVEEEIGDGQDGPRMPTIVGIRRRGYTPESLQKFAERIGVTKFDSWVDMSTL